LVEELSGLSETFFGEEGCLLLRCFVGGGAVGATGAAAARCWDGGAAGAGGANFGRGDSLSAVRCFTELNMRLSRSSSLLLLLIVLLLALLVCCCVERLRLCRAASTAFQWTPRRA